MFTFHLKCWNAIKKKESPFFTQKQRLKPTTKTKHGEKWEELIDDEGDDEEGDYDNDDDVEVDDDVEEDIDVPGWKLYSFAISRWNKIMKTSWGKQILLMIRWTCTTRLFRCVRATVYKGVSDTWCARPLVDRSVGSDRRQAVYLLVFFTTRPSWDSLTICSKTIAKNSLCL